MIVTHVLGNCPECGYERFGNVMVLPNFILRGCGRCDYSVRIPLPLTRKRVVYLDQPFFSGAFRGGDPRFVELAAKIQRLSASQILTSPRSFAHEAEAVQWARGAELVAFIKHTSRGHQFKQGYDVEQTQIMRGFKAWLAGARPDYAPEQKEALTAEVHNWDNYMFVDIRRPLGDGNELRERKEQSTQALVACFDDWRQSRSTYEQDVEAELAAVAKIYRDSYADYLVRVGGGDIEAMFTAPIFSMIIDRMRHYLPTDMDVIEQLRRCAEFFAAPNFASLPYQYIHSRACALLKHKVRNGAYANRERAIEAVGGFFYDLDHIAHYAPYCDAIAMDRPMAEMMGDPRIDLEARFGVKVFSLSNLEEFHTWLDDIEDRMSEEHREALCAAYP
ncbi:hypothetical protein [Xanthomonas sp. WHRI 7945]|nr:hypothetical protein [Xanthomonas campestris pv. campestris]